MSMRHPAKVATPATAARGLVVQLSVAPAAVVMARVTVLVPVVGLPLMSWTATTGWVAKVVLPVELEGLGVKTSLLGTAVMVKLALIALVRPAAVAVSV